MSELDELWVRVRGGDRPAFADWMGRVERPIRRALQPFASVVDAEGVVQETLLRMWILARDGGRELSGDDASLRWAIGLARNLARNEARKVGRMVVVPPDEVPEPAHEPDPMPDPHLAAAIDECLKRLGGKPLAALLARLRRSARESDRDLAAALGMAVNTFLQNIVRARRQLAACLEGKGVSIEEFIR